MCGRRKMEREHPELCNWGDMDYETLRKIAIQVPRGIVVQMHNNGEPLLYPALGNALACFKKNIRCFNTNGKALLEKAGEIVGNLETLTISVIENDEEWRVQRDAVLAFLEKKGGIKPSIVFRLLGNVDKDKFWGRELGIVARRVLHDPAGSKNYQRNVTIPEIGLCLDLLTHMAIDRFGNISMCVRFDPKGELRIGHVNTGLAAAWASPKRRKYIEYHIQGRRSELPGCRECDYWGCPTAPCEQCGTASNLPKDALEGGDGLVF